MATDILQALNEIQAQLAALTFNDGENPPTLPGEAIVNIANNIEALRSTLETRSLAETVGQNTNFADLIAALGLIKLICCPPAVRVNIGGTPIADLQPTTPGTEFGSPPPRFEPTDETPGSAAY